MLTMFATGLTQTEIAEALVISPLTVKRRIIEIANGLGLAKKQARGAALVAWTWKNLMQGEGG